MMKGIVPDTHQDGSQWRRTTGADRWDEVWDGSLRLTPPPTREQLVLEGELELWLHLNWALAAEGKVCRQLPVSLVKDWETDFRIPDLALLGPDQLELDRGDHLSGPPLVAIELHSEAAPTYDKLIYYAQIGVREIWVIPIDGGEVEIYRCKEGVALLAGPSNSEVQSSREIPVKMRMLGRRSFEICSSNSGGEASVIRLSPDMPSSDDESFRRWPR